jgi:hypothetical protein
MSHIQNIVVCTLSIGEEYKETVKYATLSKEKYCQKHNYIFIDGEDIHYNMERDIRWSKIKLLIKCLNDYPSCDYIVWLDADTLIINDEIILKDIIIEHMENKTFMMCRDNGFLINTGVWFIKNNLYALKMLNMIYEHPNVKPYIFENYHEQGSYTFLYDNNIENLRDNSIILPTSYQHVFNCSYCFYKDGYFLVHYLGITNRYILKQMISFMSPFQLENESLEDYNNRYKSAKDRYQISSFERDIVIPNQIREEKEKRRSRICVCTFNIGEKYKEATKYGSLSKKKYCEKWKYSFDDDESIYDDSRHPAWSKVLLLKKCLTEKLEDKNKYDFVVWMDADTMIMNDEILLEDLIDKYMDDTKDFLVSRDNGYRINTGVWFIRNNEYSLKILDKVWDNTDKGEMEYWEQGSFCYFHNINEDDLKNHVVDLSTDMQKEFNCMYCFYKYGYFLVHFLYFRDPEQLSIKMNEMYIYQKETESEEQYKSRLDHIKNFYEICLFERYPPP